MKESTEDGQVYKHVEELTEDGHKYEHNKMFEERCGIKHETITVVSLLFINLVIHCHSLALSNCVFSTASILLHFERAAVQSSSKDMVLFKPVCESISSLIRSINALNLEFGPDKSLCL